MVLFAIAGGVAAYNLITTERNYSTARNEYEELRTYVQTHAITSPDTGDNESEDADSSPAPVTIPDMSSINPDYVGWIRVEGTGVDYPMVQGADNEKYLNITFTGVRNPSGAIFLDSRTIGGFSGFTLVHGHNMRDGSMFGGLYHLLDIELDNDFQEVFPEITIFTPDGNVLKYQIFAVRRTTNNDAVFMLPERGFDAVSEYFSGFGFSNEEMQNILVLATCTTGSRNERLLVMATRTG